MSCPEFVTERDLVDFRARLVPLHAVAGFGGWLGFTAIGVSYRLLSMFMLAPEREGVTGRAAWWSGIGALALLIFIVPFTFLLGSGTEVAEAAAGTLAGAALVFYAADLTFLYRNRRRRSIELNTKAAFGAIAMLYLSALILAAVLLTGTLARHAAAIVYLVAAGWLTGLGLSQLYKIVPFLTWLECYGPVLGRKPTPRVQDLVAERRAAPWFALYFLGVLAGAASLLVECPGLFRLTAAVTLVASGAIVTHLILARRLSNIAVAQRPAAGTARPRLFLPATNRD